MPVAVDVTGWRIGFKSISFVKLLRHGSQAERGLAEAKALVDGLLAGKTFAVTFKEAGEASDFIRNAELLGAVTALRNSD